MARVVDAILLRPRCWILYKHRDIVPSISEKVTTDRHTQLYLGEHPARLCRLWNSLQARVEKRHVAVVPPVLSHVS